MRKPRDSRLRFCSQRAAFRARNRFTPTTRATCCFDSIRLLLLNCYIASSLAARSFLIGVSKFFQAFLLNRTKLESSPCSRGSIRARLPSSHKASAKQCSMAFRCHRSTSAFAPGEAASALAWSLRPNSRAGYLISSFPFCVDQPEGHLRSQSMSGYSIFGEEVSQ